MTGKSTTKKPPKARQKNRDIPVGPGKTVDEDDAQPPLIPMSEEELLKASRDLAAEIRVLEDLEADHAQRRKDMTEERAAKRNKIAALARSIRQQGR